MQTKNQTRKQFEIGYTFVVPFLVRRVATSSQVCVVETFR